MRNEEQEEDLAEAGRMMAVLLFKTLAIIAGVTTSAYTGPPSGAA